MATTKAPGQSHRKGITIMEFSEMVPDEAKAQSLLESWFWPNGRHCPRCKSLRTVESRHANMPYWCTECRSYFSVRTGNLLEASKVPLRKWAWAIYLHLTSLKGVSSMKLHRDIGVSQPTAWFMLQRIRKAFDGDDEPPFTGPVELDEAYFGGKRHNMSNTKRKNLEGTGRGAVGKTAVVGAKDRKTGKVKAQVVDTPDRSTLQSFVDANVAFGATIYTDGASAYHGVGNMFNNIHHHSVNHTVGEYVRGMAHTNGVESFWAMLKRGYQGTYHRISPKHLHRYIAEFAGRHSIRALDTLDQMAALAQGMVGKRLKYRELVA